MLQLLINLLTPIFEGMGVSPTDVATYVHNLSGYIYAILGTLGLAWNNGVLPLSGTDKINVFGWAATNPIYGGTGSGSSSNEGNIDILTSLKNAGFEVNQELIDMYTEYSPTRTLAGVGVGFTDWSLPEPPADRYTDELMNNAKAFSDTAVIVLARSGGEGQDLPTDMSKVIDGTIDNMRQTEANGNAGYNYYAASFTNNSENYDDFAPKESYLQLSRSERDMVDLVAANFDQVDQLTPEEMSQLVQIGGFSTVALKSVDKKATMDSDGTGGLNDWYAGVYGTPYPTEVLIAQTWNKELAYEVGGAIGQEYADCHIYGWYGPAMNTHRTAFNGRNFEYYSEDGVLAGCIASAEINAAGEKGIYAYIKHYVHHRAQRQLHRRGRERRSGPHDRHVHRN